MLRSRRLALFAATLAILADGWVIPASAQSVFQQMQDQQQQLFWARLSGLQPYCGAYGTCAVVGYNAYGPYNAYGNYFNPGGVLTPTYRQLGLCQLGDAACPVTRESQLAEGPVEAGPAPLGRHRRTHHRRVAHAQ